MTQIDASKILQHVQREDEETYAGVLLSIACDEVCAGVQVTGVTMFVGTDSGEGVDDEDDDYCWADGDLAVEWKSTGNKEQDDAAAYAFYCDGAFTARLCELLTAAGFTAEAAAGVDGSESGMQDDERASYDAAEIASEVRAAMGVTR